MTDSVEEGKDAASLAYKAFSILDSADDWYVFLDAIVKINSLAAYTMEQEGVKISEDHEGNTLQAIHNLSVANLKIMQEYLASNS